MQRSNPYRVLLVIALFVVSAVVVSGPQATAAIFTSMASSTVSDVSLSGDPLASFVSMNLPAPDGVTLMGPTTSGTGVISTQSFFNDAGFGTQTASVAGSATSPPSSFASAEVLVHDLVEVFNTAGSSAAVLEFTFAYTASSTVSATPPGEDAFANFFFHITGTSDEVGETLEVDTGSGFVAMPDFEIDVSKLASMGDTGGSLTDSIKVKYTAAPFGGGADGEYAFSIFTRASGAARAGDVPEPGSIAVWSIFCLVLSAFGWRRARRRV